MIPPLLEDQHPKEKQEVNEPVTDTRESAKEKHMKEADELLESFYGKDDKDSKDEDNTEKPKKKKQHESD